MFRKLFDLIYEKYLSCEESKKFGLSYSGLARFLGVSVGKVQTWREDGKWPNTPDVAVLHKKLGFSLQWLVTGEGDPFADTPADTQGENPAVLRAELEQVKQELDEERRLNRQLTTRLLIDGVGDKGAQTSTGKAGDGAK